MIKNRAAIRPFQRSKRLLLIMKGHQISNQGDLGHLPMKVHMRDQLFTRRVVDIALQESDMAVDHRRSQLEFLKSSLALFRFIIEQYLLRADFTRRGSLYFSSLKDSTSATCGPAFIAFFEIQS